MMVKPVELTLKASTKDTEGLTFDGRYAVPYLEPLLFLEGLRAFSQSAPSKTSTNLL